MQTTHSAPLVAIRPRVSLGYQKRSTLFQDSPQRRRGLKILVSVVRFRSRAPFLQNKSSAWI